jgi:hypothetical protein
VGRAVAVAAFGQSRVRVVLPLLKTGARIMDARDSGARPRPARPAISPGSLAQGLIRHQANRANLCQNQKSQASSLEAG